MKRLPAIAFAAAYAALAQGQDAPPITHDIKGYYVLKQENNCLECHDEPRDIGKKPKKGMPRPAPMSHYEKREGKLAIDEAHFLCTNCHKPS